MAFSIRHTAVIGAGTMGRQIAAVIANSNTPVLLLDIVPRDTNDRNALAHQAIEKLGSGKGMLNERKLSLIQPGNIEDDLDKLEEVDWVIECVTENEKVKRKTYEKLGQHVKDTTLISSNTSTIPLSALKKDLDDALQRQLCITHFFNPPSKMPLLELVTDQDNDPYAIAVFTRFADEKLGRNVLPAKDTSGFIANRIGLFWLLCAIGEAKKEGISMEMADAIMDGAFGFPKTGIFALADLIGLKLIVEMAESMCHSLMKDDAFCQLESGLEAVRQQLESGARFYQEKPRQKPTHIEHWHAFLEQETPESRFARSTLTHTLGYAAAVASVVADNILQVDEAMRDGYGWQYGPFEIIDHLGPAWLSECMEKHNMHVPLLLKQAEAKGFFYQISEEGGREYLSFSGRYRQQRMEKDKWTLALVTAGRKPVLQNAAAELYDVGDGIACLAFTKGSMHVINEAALDLLWQAVQKVESDFQGMIIGHDGKNFSAGLDLHIVRESMEDHDPDRIDRIIKQGQECMKNVKQSQVPIVAATFGYALGGGCELVLHCTAAQAYVDTRIGLVETGIGVIPAWGGTKELLLTAVQQSDKDASAITARVVEVFRRIANAKKSDNAEDAFAAGWLDKPSRISVNRARLLPDAKALCLDLAKNFVPVSEQIIELPVKTLYRSLMQEVMVFTQQEHPLMTQHRHKVLETLAETLSGYRIVKSIERIDESPRRPGWIRLSEQQVLDSTHSAFMELVQEEESLEKIGSVLR